jgi:hypothetical protein
MPWRTVTIDERRHAWNVAEPIPVNVLASRYKQDTRHAPRRSGIHALDIRVRYWRTKHESIRGSRQDNVVRVAAVPRD